MGRSTVAAPEILEGQCPYCGGEIEIPALPPDETLAFERAPCPHCKATYWIRHSQLDPAVYTNEAFGREYIVDPDNKTIESRQLPVPEQFVAYDPDKLGAPKAVCKHCGNTGQSFDGPCACPAGTQLFGGPT